MGLLIGQGLESHSIAAALSQLESMGVECVAESQGGLGARGHEEVSPRRMFELKQFVFAISGLESQ